MPMPPRPFTFVCRKCSWKKTVAPRSDALGPGEWFKQCPKCRDEDVTMRPATPLEKLLAELSPWH